MFVAIMRLIEHLYLFNYICYRNSNLVLKCFSSVGAPSEDKNMTDKPGNIF